MTEWKRPALRWRLKNDFYQLILDGLWDRKDRLESAHARATKDYSRLVNRATGHFGRDKPRTVLALIVGTALAYATIAYWAVRAAGRKLRFDKS